MSDDAYPYDEKAGESMMNRLRLLNVETTVSQYKIYVPIRQRYGSEVGARCVHAGETPSVFEVSEYLYLCTGELDYRYIVVCL